MSFLFPSMSSLLLLFIFFLSLSFALFLTVSAIIVRQHKHCKEEESKDSSATWLPPQPLIEDSVLEEKRKKKKGKKKKKKMMNIDMVDGREACPEEERAVRAEDVGCRIPFSMNASVTQRKIKVQYDELVRSNQANQLNMAQVGQFVNCLVDAKNELQQKSEIIRRSFKIKKALLVKANKSSFDRLCQQIYKLEADSKRLEEDVAVYNLLQEQLKLSPAYRTMLEIGANMELKESEDQSADLCDISFDELLAQEKKDSFWKRNGKLRSFPS